ncbi:MAG: class I SAM-dependent methyltransferase [Acidobacteriia bacterium]|nr:class I SAM-dependent methyltransferase [Methyloceanibacter sp.]MCL6491328.1 class I SAM-dependent methyltransferase [Terriglobia bacterium]
MEQEGAGGRAAEVICVQKPQRAEDIDEKGYLDANPDVRKAGMSAREHFVTYGVHEGRMQFINHERVAEMREQKLRRLRFRREPSALRRRGEPANFLDAQTIAEFDIPEHPPVSANLYGGPFIEEILSQPERLCLDLGAGLRASYFSNIVNTEIYPWISTDVLCVGEDLPFADEQFDYVICCAVLEHTLRPWDVAREICRVLKPGGKLLVDYPFLQGVHGYPHHYFNATPLGAVSLFARQCEIISSTIEANNHPIQSIWWILHAWREGLAGADRERFEQLTIGEILATPPDAQLAAPYCKNLSEEALRTIPAGSTLIARKKTPSPFAGPESTRGGPTESDRIRMLEAEIAALRASRSWRLTAPLRALHRIGQNLRLRK